MQRANNGTCSVSGQIVGVKFENTRTCFLLRTRVGRTWAEKKQDVQIVFGYGTDQLDVLDNLIETN